MAWVAAIAVLGPDGTLVPRAEPGARVRPVPGAELEARVRLVPGVRLGVGVTLVPGAVLGPNEMLAPGVQRAAGQMPEPGAEHGTDAALQTVAPRGRVAMQAVVSGLARAEDTGRAMSTAAPSGVRSGQGPGLAADHDQVAGLVRVAEPAVTGSRGGAARRNGDGAETAVTESSGRPVGQAPGQGPVAAIAAG